MIERFPIRKIRLAGTAGNNQKGFSIILHSGTVIFTERKNEHVVSEKSIKKLEENGIFLSVSTKMAASNKNRPQRPPNGGVGAFKFQHCVTLNVAQFTKVC